jgi:hypothetical protein
MMAEQLNASGLDQRIKRDADNLYATNTQMPALRSEFRLRDGRHGISSPLPYQAVIRHIGRAGLLILMLLLAACQHKVRASYSPALDIPSGYLEKIPGKYLLQVKSERLSGKFGVSGQACGTHSFSLDLAEAFEGSVVRTIENLIEQVDRSEIATDRYALRLLGYRGLIRVIGEDLEVDIKAIQGLWSVEMEAEIKLTAAYIVDGLEGRLAGGRVYAEAKDRHDAGAVCSGGAIAVQKSAERALRRLMQQLGERIANEPRLRHSTE